MANEYDYPVYDAGGRVETYKEGGKVKEDKEQQKVISLEDTSDKVSSSYDLKREDKQL